MALHSDFTCSQSGSQNKNNLEGEKKEKFKNVYPDNSELKHKGIKLRNECYATHPPHTHTERHHTQSLTERNKETGIQDLGDYSCILNIKGEILMWAPEGKDAGKLGITKCAEEHAEMAQH